MSRVFVIGHVNPDTDSIAAAMGYAWLLRERDGVDTVAARAGALNPQSAWVLKHLNLEPNHDFIDYLRQDRSSATLTSLIMRDPLSSLTVLLGGRRSDIATDELVMSDKMGRILASARKHFDYVILDTPHRTPSPRIFYTEQPRSPGGNDTNRAAGTVRRRSSSFKLVTKRTNRPSLICIRSHSHMPGPIRITPGKLKSVQPATGNAEGSYQPSSGNRSSPSRIQSDAKGHSVSP